MAFALDCVHGRCHSSALAGLASALSGWLALNFVIGRIFAILSRALTFPLSAPRPGFSSVCVDDADHGGADPCLSQDRRSDRMAFRREREERRGAPNNDSPRRGVFGRASRAALGRRRHWAAQGRPSPWTWVRNTQQSHRNGEFVGRKCLNSPVNLAILPADPEPVMPP